MNILLTGATGFIGRACHRAALARGHRVAGLMRPGRPDEPGLTRIDGTLAEFSLAQIKAFRPDVCIHSAWIATPGVYLESPENRDYVRWSLEFIRQVVALGVRQVVVLGTCIEYRMDGQILREDSSPLEPVSLYARCKHELHQQLATEAAADGYNLAWGRVFYPYGPGEHPARLCSALITKLRAGERLELKTPHSTKDYIFSEDLAAAILCLAEKKAQGAFNLGTGEGIAVRALADAVAQELGRPELVANAPNLTVDPLANVVADATKLRSLGWQPRTGLREGIQKLVAEFR